MPGPAPDPNALRRDRADDKGTWTTLPAVGRVGDPPEWPLTRPTRRELDMWAKEWARPQALMWEKNHQEREVANYVRTAIACEGRPDPKLLPILLRQETFLGVNQEGLMRRRWKIEDAPHTPMTRGNDSTDRRSAKARFRTIEGGAAKAS